MKKFLSLMLAMIMVMSLVTVGAGAAFTDAEDIQYTEAVDLMTGLGILQGPGDGTFNPKGNLSRGAAAKIIAYIALGAEAADTMTYDTVMFPDVPTTSATAPYIAWCAEQGIVNGYSDGTFGRSNTVSGHAFLKMALTAIGEFGQYTGTGWQIRVLNAANKAGVELLKGIDTDKVTLSDPLSREAACQIAFNAMKVNKTGFDGYLLDGKKYTDLTQALIYAQLTGITVEPTYVYVAPGQLLKDVHKVVATPVTGVITKNGANADTDFTVIGGENYAIETGLAQLGNTVKVYVKTGTYDAAKGYTVVSMTDSCTEIVVTKDMKADALKAALKAAGITKDVAAEDVAALAADGTVGTEDVAITVGTTTGKTLGAKTLVINDKKVVGVKYALDKSLEKIGKIETKEDAAYITVGSTQVKNGYKVDKKVVDQINAYEGIAKDDIVVLTKIGDIYNVEKAATVTGKLTKIDENKLTVNGTTYAQLGTNNTTIAVADALNFETEYTLYLDGQGNYIAIKVAGEAPTSSTVYVVAAYTVKGKTTTDAYGKETTSKDTYFVQAIDTNGKEVIYQTATLESSLKGTYKVTVEYNETVKADCATFEATGKKFDTDVTAKDIKIKDTTYYFADDVKFISVVTKVENDEIVLSKTKATVKTGVQAVENPYYVISKTSGDNNTVTIVFVDGALKAADPETVKDVVYAVEKAASTAKVPYADKDGKTKTGYEHVLYIDGVKTTIITNDAAALEGFITLTKNGEGYTTAANTKGNLYDTVKVTNVYGTKITFADLEDVEAADAEIIDLYNTKAADKVTSVDKLKDCTVSVVTDKSGDDVTVVTIYVIG